MEEDFIPFFNADQEGSNGRFLTGNSHLVTEEGENDFVGMPYSIHTVSTGEKIMLLGFLYNFEFAASNTEVRDVATALQEPWFGEAMAEEFDMVVVTAHIDPSDSTVNQIIDAIHQKHDTTPVIFFAGHR